MVSAGVLNPERVSAGAFNPDFIQMISAGVLARSHSGSAPVFQLAWMVQQVQVCSTLIWFWCIKADVCGGCLSPFLQRTAHQFKNVAALCVCGSRDPVPLHHHHPYTLPPVRTPPQPFPSIQHCKISRVCACCERYLGTS